MALANGSYHTAAGSQVRISGKHSGISEIDFEWMDEGVGCIEARPTVDHQDGRLNWYCECHGDGSAELLFNLGVE